MLAGSVASRTVVRQGIIVEGHDRALLLTSWQSDKKGMATRYIFPGHAPSPRNLLPLTRPTFYSSITSQKSIQNLNLSMD
jgi:hypothetical protein